jgi:hypothetical protein
VCAQDGRKRTPRRKTLASGHSAARTHVGEGHATKKDAEGGINSFRELLEFGETQNVKELRRGTHVRWSDKAEARRFEMQLRLKREENLSSRHRGQLKHELERDRKLLNPPAVAKRACPDAATGSPSSKRVAKKSPCAGCQTNGEGATRFFCCFRWLKIARVSKRHPP